MERSSLPTSSNKVTGMDDICSDYGKEEYPDDCSETVECVDPFDLFNTFKPLLLKHLPLRRLNWKSSNRPLRSIDTLYVDLIPAKHGTDAASAPERRHQIPGLRQTPYLKVYLLRCDSTEAYKATCRKQIRDWIKSNPLPGESKKGPSSQENHDAYEWLIVHLVFTEEADAAQSRTSRTDQLGTTDSTDSITNKSKSSGKSSLLILEKLRADFNSSSKSNVDRVAQIHIAKAGQQTSAESKEQFLDLVEKLKVTILASFDLRVRQYEDDIRERDSQRNLPGWNFNTFFILKEGLARGFENVGLFDDALIGYDELALGLEVVIREQLEGTGSDHGGRFLHCSEELKDKIQACLKDADEEASMDGQLSLDLGLDPASRLQRRDYTLDTHRSPFRDLILANDISIFDFRLYIFSRQLNLLLRNANALSIADQRSEAPPNKSEHDDRFLPLAEACQRAVDFITKGARTLRHDLELALDVSESMPTEDRTFRRLVISNYILSWTYVSALQVLAQTSSPNLVLPPAELSLERQSSVKTDVVRHRPRSLLRSPSPTKMGMAERSPRPASAIATLPSNKSNNKTGTEELAGARAELYSLARTAVEEIGNQHGWTRQWHISTSNVMQDVSLETNHLTNGESTEERKKPFINGLQHLDLRSAFRSQDTFKTLFECLTMFIYRHDLAAKRTKSSEKTMGEIATLKYEAGKYDEAASYFSSIASFHRESQWLELESMFLELYVDCLKKLGCHGEYVSNLLTLLGRPENQQLHLSKPAMATEERYMPDLWSYSDKLTTPIHAKLSNFFSIKGLAPYIQHYQDMDGFFICMKIGFLLGGALELSEGLQITLSSIHDSPMAVIVLRSGPSPITVTRLSKKVELGSNLSVCGWYAIESIQIKIGNILFIEDYSTLRKAFASDEQARPNPMAALRLFVYPPAHSLRATASPAPYLHLAQPRSILLELETGRNDIQSCDVSMKSGTAGLRLHLHETQMDSDDGSASSSMVSPREGMQAIRLVDCPADSNYKLLVPYTVENAEIPIINVKLDVEYRAVAGTFVYSTQIVVNTILPISVNVQDNFKEDALFSRFTISPATLVPLRLLKCDMQGFEDAYVVECDENGQGVMDVFPKQPASLVYRITRKEPRSMRSSPEPLALSVKFTCLDEVVLKVMEKRFIAFVTASPIVSLVQPLCAHLLSTFRSQWTAQDLEIIGLCHEIEVWAYEDLGWEPILMGFNVQVRDLAKTWLKKWHEENAVIPIYEDSQDEHPQPLRQIVIPVDFPTPAIVATASLELASRRTEALTIGEALLAEVRVSCMQNWATGDHSAEENGQLEIHFEVLAPLENWIVGGVRKGRFSAEESTKSVPVILLPQRTGHLLLPSIEVKCYKPQAERSNSSFGPARGTEVACEVDIKSLARSVHVVSGLRETVVGIDIVEAQGQVGEKRTLLVGSKGREIPVRAQPQGRPAQRMTSTERPK